LNRWVIPTAAGDGGLCRGIVAEAVAQLRADAKIAKRRQKVAVVVHLGRVGHDPHGRTSSPVAQLCGVRWLRVGRLCAQLVGVDERAFQMGTQHPCFVSLQGVADSSDGIQKCRNVTRRRRDRSGQQGCRSVTGVKPRRCPDGVCSCHHVRPAAAVNVQVDKAGQDVGRVRAVGRVP